MYNSVTFCKNTFLKQIIGRNRLKKTTLHQSKKQRKENFHHATQPNQYAGRIIRSGTFSSSQTNKEMQVNCNSNMQPTYWSIQSAVKSDLLESLRHH